ncbi:hypothetical protein L7F22_068913 [Adiantum nelumboides]|nr:hypothetical protein [Adiantum nelumboides]
MASSSRQMRQEMLSKKRQASQARQQDSSTAVEEESNKSTHGATDMTSSKASDESYKIPSHRVVTDSSQSVSGTSSSPKAHPKAKRKKNTKRKGPIFIGRDTPSLRARLSPLDSVSDIWTEDRVVYHFIFAIEALLESIKVLVHDLEELCEQSKARLATSSISGDVVYQRCSIDFWHSGGDLGSRDGQRYLQRIFSALDLSNELHIFTYKAEKLSSLSLFGWRTDILNSQHVGLSKDTLVLLDCSDPRNLKLFDTSTGKEMEQMIRHVVPIMDVDMNQQGKISDRMLLFIDSNSDLYIACIKKPCTIKLASLTTKALWSSDAHIVAAMVEQDLVVWLYPQAAFIDEDLLSILEAKKECFKGKNVALHSFQANRFFVHYDNGAVVTKSMSPKPFLLFEYIASNYWEQAKKLCWVFKEVPLWASLAAAAMNAKLYDIAQEAYTALGQIDKSEFIKHLKGQASEVVLKAEHALFTRQLKDAESVLLKAGLIYRAIKVNLRLLNWDRALEIALLHKKHIDTVLWKRGQYLSDTNQEETKDAFKNLKDQVPIDVETIKQNISEEKTRENNKKE